MTKLFSITTLGLCSLLVFASCNSVDKTNIEKEKSATAEELSQMNRGFCKSTKC